MRSAPAESAALFGVAARSVGRGFLGLEKRLVRSDVGRVRFSCAAPGRADVGVRERRSV